MVEVITMNDGERVFICSDRDVLEVVEHYCGYDFMKLIENMFEDKSEEGTALEQELRASEYEYEQLRDCILEISCILREYQVGLNVGKKKRVLPIINSIINQINEVL